MASGIKVQDVSRHFALTSRSDSRFMASQVSGDETIITSKWALSHLMPWQLL